MTLRVDGLYGFYATIEPAPKGRLPWPGRMGRWWFEIMGPSDDAECPVQHYYMYDGSGLSLRRCLWNAEEAVFKAERDHKNNTVRL